MNSVGLNRVTATAIASALLLAVGALMHGQADSSAATPTAVASQEPGASTPSAAPSGAGDLASPLPTHASTTSPRPRPRATASRATSVRASGVLVTVPGASGVLGAGPLKRYKVQVEQGLPVNGAAFAAQVQQVLGSPHGWGHGGRASFQRVSSGRVAFTVVLASPATTDRMCRPLRTGGRLSCYDSRGHAVINFTRWSTGAASYAGHLAAYREYVISHEVGHALGHGHVYSCRADGLAPTMMQQTKSLYGCARNPWPFPPSEPED